ncbi:MAG: hypothetical protein IBX47_05150 [Desulfuromonadales bacterium]|nr:hypothetical protein [Desulfuromonadales bacterium]
MEKTTKRLLLSLLLLAATVIPATAQTVTLTWDQNTEAEVNAYKIYYRTDTATLPFNGTSLAEGASPITVSGSASTALSINLPEDGNIYYFAATAVSNSGVESSFSEIIASEWIPHLQAPAKNATVGTAANFSWGLPPSGYNVTYELHYGTDPNLRSNAAATIAPKSFTAGWPQLKLSLIVPLAILFSLLMAIRAGRTKRIWRPIRTGFCIGLLILQASCGGGGDSALSTDQTTPAADSTSPATAQPLFTKVVTGISTTGYAIDDLQSDSVYYWKIVAIDSDGFPYESITQSFTTATN